MKVGEEREEQLRMRSQNYVGMVREVGGTPVVSRIREALGEHFKKRVGLAAAGAPVVK